MNRRIFSSTVVLGLLAAVAPGVTAAKAAERPNVLFIAVDDLNDWIGCLGGNPDCRSPNIDRLAASGLLFTRSYCAAPACNPSRAALMTGIRPATSGVYHNSQPWRPALPDAVTLPQHFMAAGYDAVGSGKIYHGSFPDPPSWRDYLSKTGDPKPSEAVLGDPHSKAGGIVWGVLDVANEQMDDYKMVDYAVDYLNETHDKPFFLACGIFKPHMPWQVPRRYYEMYPRERLTLPIVPADDLADVPAAGVAMARPTGDHKNVIDTDNWRYAVQAYLASITFADDQVGRLLDSLAKSRYADDTIVILWGDHGWHLGEKHHWRKFSLWEEATRAPLMIRAPGVTKPNSLCDRPVDFIDIYPTLCELCGLPIGGHLDGKSLAPLLKDPGAQWNEPALTTHGRNNHALRSERFRYIRYADGSEELYDHDADPMEWTNLADDPKYAGVKQELAVWFPATNAEGAAFETGVKKSKGKAKGKK